MCPSRRTAVSKVTFCKTPRLLAARIKRAAFALIRRLGDAVVGPSLQGAEPALLQSRDLYTPIHYWC